MAGKGGLIRRSSSSQKGSLRWLPRRYTQRWRGALGEPDHKQQLFKARRFPAINGPSRYPDNGLWKPKNRTFVKVVATRGRFRENASTR
jgi:hypothetical protein